MPHELSNITPVLKASTALYYRLPNIEEGVWGSRRRFLRHIVSCIKLGWGIVTDTLGMMRPPTIDYRLLDTSAFSSSTHLSHIPAYEKPVFSPY